MEETDAPSEPQPSDLELQIRAELVRMLAQHGAPASSDHKRSLDDTAQRIAKLVQVAAQAPASRPIETSLPGPGEPRH